MLGRVRASPASSLELLEMERLPSKIIKNDSLSIYESTLLKLKQGSQCNPTCDMATDDADCSSSDSSSGFQSSKEQGNRNMLILDLFSKYKSSHLSHNSNDKGAVVMETVSYFSSSSSSSSSSSCSSLSPTSSN